MARARVNGAPPQRLVTWALATFPATLFVVASVLFAYTRGGLGSLLANLNTLVGLGLFAALWATTFLTTQRALEGIDVLGTMDDRAFVRRVFRWGAANGMAFLAVLAVVFLVGSLAAIPAARAPGFIWAAAFPAPLPLACSAAARAPVGE